jgi:membrane protease YdiL (CAAX protease family)
MLTQMLLPLFARIAPGYVLGLAALIAIPRQRLELRLAVYILLFVLFRDAMTPTGLWSISPACSIRFTHEPALLVDLGLLAFVSVFVINAFEPDLAKLIVWVKGKAYWAILAGILSAGLIVGPVWLLRHYLAPEVPLPVATAAELGPLLTLCLLGNFLEEVLFRGYFQGIVEKVSSPGRAAFASGLFFALCHSFLAVTVTNVGSPLLAFTWFEGTVAGLVRMRFGVIAATLTHGLAIFALAAGVAG